MAVTSRLGLADQGSVSGRTARKASFQPGAVPPSAAPAMPDRRPPATSPWQVGKGLLHDGAEAGFPVLYRIPSVVRHDMPWSRGVLQGNYELLEKAQFTCGMILTLGTGRRIQVYVVSVSLKVVGEASIILQGTAP